MLFRSVGYFPNGNDLKTETCTNYNQVLQFAHKYGANGVSFKKVDWRRGGNEPTIVYFKNSTGSNMNIVSNNTWETYKRINGEYGQCGGNLQVPLRDLWPCTLTHRP